MIFADEHIVVSKHMKDVLIVLGVCSQDFVDYLERNSIIAYSG